MSFLEMIHQIRITGGELSEEDFQKIADSFFLPTIIVSVEKKGDGQYGDRCAIYGGR